MREDQMEPFRNSNVGRWAVELGAHVVSKQAVSPDPDPDPDSQTQTQDTSGR